MTKPLPEVVREMNDVVDDGLLREEYVRPWSAAITDHLARLEALASKIDEEADRFDFSATDIYDGGEVADRVRDFRDKLRALLSPAGAAASADDPVRNDLDPRQHLRGKDAV